MPKAYMVFSYQSPPDPQKLAAYGKLAIPAFEPFGARLLARGTAAAAYEHGLKERILIIEFPSLEKAIAAHDSPPVIVQEAGNAPATIPDGTVLEVKEPDTGKVTFAGPTGTLWLDSLRSSPAR